MRLIDADALKASVERQCAMIHGIDPDMEEIAEVLRKGIFQEVNNAPTIDLSEQAKRDIATIIENEMDMRVLADRKHGKWEAVGSTTMGDPFGELAWGKMYKCSECGFVRHVIKDSEHYKFCPNCGAQLENPA